MRPPIDAALVRGLIRSQFPEWANLPLAAVKPGGVDNRTYRLGRRMLVRLPSAQGYAPQVDKEHEWLPILGRQLPLPIPVPLAKGRPSEHYPFSWSIYEWIEGEASSLENVNDLTEFAGTLAHFLLALQRIDPTKGPQAGAHSFYRGAPLAIYDLETRAAIEEVKGQIQAEEALQVWEASLAATSTRSPVWFHGDVAVGNLLIRDGRLAAVIDFGCSGVGDPACDLVIAWTLLEGQSREVFRASLSLDKSTWARGRGWALWKALITLAEYSEIDPIAAAGSRRVIEQVVADHGR